jgi:hypothetical protein
MNDNQTQNNSPVNANQTQANPASNANQSAGSPFAGQPAGPGQPLSPGARQLNDLLNRFARPFLAKCLTRLITWGATAVCGYLALGTPDSTWTTQTAATAASIICLLTATTIDRWHHKADTSR